MSPTEAGKRKRGNPLRILVWGAAGLLLLLPWVAMQFTAEVNWSPMDFLVFGAMLLTACGSYELATRLSVNRAYRLAVAIAILGAFLMVWVNLAVGIIGNTGHPANLMYMAVIAFGALAAIVVRFEPARMAGVLFFMVLAQAVVALVTVFAGLEGPSNPLHPHRIFNGLLIGMWAGSAWLFRKASRAPADAG